MRHIAAQTDMTLMENNQEQFYKKGEDAATGIVFADAVTGFADAQRPGCVLHILCLHGGMSFMLHDVRYNVAPQDYVILPNAALASGFNGSSDVEAIVMSLSETLVASLALRSNYGVIGHLSLLQNPVMKLSGDDFAVCREAMLGLRRRIEGSAGHLFRSEMLSHLLMAHILDLYDIHARGRSLTDVPERARQLLGRFIGMLYGGEYMTHRGLEHYASRLCVTPHYLSEVCRKASGKPASYWIDRFALNGITRLLLEKDMPLADVAERMNFSSLSYFSRYVQKHTGLSPSDYRRAHARHGGTAAHANVKMRKNKA